MDITKINEITDNLRGWKKVIFRIIYMKMNEEIFTIESLYDFEQYLKAIFFDAKDIKSKIKETIDEFIKSGYLLELNNGYIKKVLLEDKHEDTPMVKPNTSFFNDKDVANISDKNKSYATEDSICEYTLKKDSKENIYNEFIKGEIYYGKNFKYLIFNYDKHISYLCSISNTDYHNKKSMKLVIQYREFLNLNLETINRFHDNQLDKDNFIIEASLKEHDFYNKVNRKYALEDIYNIFSKLTLYFGYFSEEIYFDEIIKYYNLLNLNVDDLNINEKIKKYWEIYYEVNHDSINILNLSINKLSVILRNNKKHFLSKVKVIEKVKQIYESINNLPDINNQKYITNLIENKEFKDTLLENQILTLDHWKDLTEYEWKKNIENNIHLNELGDIIDLCNNSFDKLLSNYFDEFLKEKLKSREYTVIKQRSNKSTLEQVGHSLGVTRERVRQIESKAKERFNLLYPDKIFNLLKTYNVSGAYINKDNILSIFGETANMFIYLNKDMYNKDVEVLEFINLSELKEFIIEKISETNLSYLHLDDLKNISDDLLKTYQVEYKTDVRVDYIIDFIKSNMFKVGEYLFFKRPSLIKKYEVILKNHFTDLSYLNAGNMDIFKDRYYEVFEEEDIYEKSTRAILARITAHKNVVLVGKGSYELISENKNKISKAKLDQIYGYIKTVKVVLTEAIFNKYKSMIYPSVRDKYELHGLLKYNYSDLYFSRDSIGLESNPSLNVTKIINDYAISHNGIINLKKLIKDLPQIRGIQYEFQISQIDTLIGMFNQNYIHVDFIKRHKFEMVKVKNEVEERLAKGEFINSRILYRIMSRLAKETIRDNNINNIHYAFNIFNYFYNGDFSYSNNQIYLIGDKSTSTSYKSFKISYLKESIFKISTIRTNALEKYVHIYSVKKFLDEIYENGYMRINDNLVAKTSLVINKHSKMIMDKVEKILIYYLNIEKSLNLEKLNFKELPQINKPWNKHLLAHMLMELSDKINVKTIGRQYNMMEYVLRKQEDNDD